jgi:histidinol phosphatase-like enzyme
MHRAVFLDQNGVLNRPVLRAGRPYPPNHLSEPEILPDVGEACEALHEAGFSPVMVTNQPDVARGIQKSKNMEAISQALCSRLPQDDTQVCYHDDADKCTCRKAEPGPLPEAAHEWNYVSPCLIGGPLPSISFLAGCTADIGRHPVPIMVAAVELLRPCANQELIWASPR